MSAEKKTLFWVCVPGKKPKTISATGIGHYSVEDAKKARKGVSGRSAIYSLTFGELPKFIEGDAIKETLQ